MVVLRQTDWYKIMQVTEQARTGTGYLSFLSWGWRLKTLTVIRRCTSYIRSSKTTRNAKTHKTKINFREEVLGTTIGLLEEGARISENWLVN
jgi:hypothetical protein